MGTAMTVNNRRKQQRRRALGISAQLQSTSGALACVIDDISRSGMFVASNAPLPRGSLLSVAINSPAWRSPVHLTGKVVTCRSSPVSGMGVEFHPLRGAEQARFLELVDSLAPLPEGPPKATAAPPRPPLQRLTASPDLTVHLRDVVAELSEARYSLQVRDNEVRALKTEVDRLREKVRLQDQLLAKFGRE